MGQTGNYLDEFSPNYTVGDFRSVAGDIFSIGIDINVAPGANAPGEHRLLNFVATVNGTQQFAYTDTPTGTTLQAPSNNGNGFSDWRLTGFNLSAFLDTDILQFGVDMLNVSGGRDQFFVIPGEATSVAEPSTIALLMTGCLGVLWVRRKSA